MSSIPFKVVFFDLGNTLVRRIMQSGSEIKFEWVEGAKNALEQLKERELRLGLISNTGNLSKSQLLILLPADFSLDTFEHNLIILSSEHEFEKPQLAAFACAVDKAEIAPGECLFCTEELSHTLAAQQIGMRAVWLPLPPRGDIKGLVTDLVDAQLL